MNKFVKPVIIFLAVLVALTVLKNVVVQSVITGVVSGAAHVPARVGSTNLSLLSTSLDIRDFRLGNPSGFPERTMADVSRIYFDFEPGDLGKGRAHFKDVDLNVKEVIVIKNKEGKLNVNALRPTPDEKRKQDQQASKPAKEGGKAPQLQIDRLKLSIGRVIYRDYSQGGKPAEQVFDINIKDRVYTNISNPSAIISLIMFEALTRTSLSRLANLDMGMFKDGASDALSQGLGLLGDGVDGAENTAKGLLKLFQ